MLSNQEIKELNRVLKDVDTTVDKEILEKKFDQMLNIADEATMSEEDIDELVEALEEERDENSEKLAILQNQNELLSVDYNKRALEFKKENTGKTMEVAIDPVTGFAVPTTTNTEYNISDVALSKLMNSLEKDINEEDIKNTISETYGASDISEEEMKVLAGLLRLPEKQLPKKIYDSLPKSIKKVINETDHALTPTQKEYAARAFLDFFKSEIKLDRTFIELEDAIKKELEDIPDLTSMYLENLKEMMEVNMLKTADELQDKNPDKAELLRKVSKAFTDCYMMTLPLKKIGNKSNINKELTKELPNYDHHCKKFNAMYLGSKLVITDMRKLLYILDRKLPEDIHIDSIKKFIILLCKIFRKMDVNNMVDHTTMYYTTKIIEALDYTNSDISTIGQIVIDNIVKVIHKIEGSK